MPAHPLSGYPPIYNFLVPELWQNHLVRGGAIGPSRIANRGLFRHIFLSNFE